jgi:hypothetical protein
MFICAFTGIIYLTIWLLTLMPHCDNQTFTPLPKLLLATNGQNQSTNPHWMPFLGQKLFKLLQPCRSKSVVHRCQSRTSTRMDSWCAEQHRHVKHREKSTDTRGIYLHIYQNQPDVDLPGSFFCGHPFPGSVYISGYSAIVDLVTIIIGRNTGEYPTRTHVYDDVTDHSVFIATSDISSLRIVTDMIQIPVINVIVWRLPHT